MNNPLYVHQQTEERERHRELRDTGFPNTDLPHPGAIMKPWDEMTEEERVAWHEQLGEASTPGEAGAFVTGLLQNPEALAEFLRVLEKHKAQSLAGKQRSSSAPAN